MKRILYGIFSSSSQEAQKKNQNNPLLRLPDELLLRIINFLPSRALLQLLQVCRDLNAIIDTEKFWAERYLRETGQAFVFVPPVVSTSNVFGTLYPNFTDSKKALCKRAIKNELDSMWEWISSNHLLASFLPRYLPNGKSDLNTTLYSSEAEYLRKITRMEALRRKVKNDRPSISLLDIYEKGYPLPYEKAKRKVVEAQYKYYILALEYFYCKDDLEPSDLFSFETVISNFNKLGGTEENIDFWEELDRRIEESNTEKVLKRLDAIHASSLTDTPEQRMVAFNNWVENQDDERKSVVLQNISLTRLPKLIGKLGNITSILFQDNYIFRIPAEIKNLQLLEELYLMNNMLSVLPEEIGALLKLEGLFLDNNVLTCLPSTITKTTKLEILQLHSNQFFLFPMEICELISIKKLQISKNYFLFLPNEIGNLVALRGLYLKDNFGLKELPDAISKLSRLETLWAPIQNASKGLAISKNLKNFFEKNRVHVTGVDLVNDNRLRFL